MVSTTVWGPGGAVAHALVAEEVVSSARVRRWVIVAGILSAREKHLPCECQELCPRCVNGCAPWREREVASVAVVGSSVG
jgi:hypothetical protein